MSWSNYGLYNGTLNHGWDLDHVIPISSAFTEDEVLKLNHFTNLQPLCSKINRDVKKQNKK
jgi:5-methylcytosine-specific restriction endonuclease McrA